MSDDKKKETKKTAKKTAKKKAPDYVARLHDEALDLADKLKKLNDFISKTKLPDSDVNVLRSQATAMTGYLNILKVRIKRLK